MPIGPETARHCVRPRDIAWPCCYGNVMTGSPASINGPDETCWQCGAPASADCAFVLKLVAHPHLGLEARGFTTKRGRRQDRVNVRVPRCPNCRFRARLSVTLVLGSAVAGAIVAPILQSLLWPHFAAPRWIRAGHRGNGGPATGIGFVIGLLLALLAVAVHRRLARIRSANSYPPVKMLRQAGWHYPSG